MNVNWRNSHKIFNHVVIIAPFQILQSYNMVLNHHEGLELWKTLLKTKSNVWIFKNLHDIKRN